MHPCCILGTILFIYLLFELFTIEDYCIDLYDCSIVNNSTILYNVSKTIYNSNFRKIY